MRCSPAVIFLLCLHMSSSHRILGLFPHIGKSHFDMIQSLMKALAARGHEMVILSHFPLASPIANYTDISVKGSVPYFRSTEHIEMTPIYGASTLTNSLLLSGLARDCCELVLKHPNTQKLINSNEKFDLIIYELFNTDCMLGFVDKFKVPSVAISSCILMPWASDRFGNPNNPAYIPNNFASFSDRMTFTERLRNTYEYILHNVLYTLIYNGPTEKTARKHFGETIPPLWDIAKNTSLILVNTHFTFNKPRPLVPAVIEIGGLHIQPPKKLPQDLQKFLDEAEHGVIYFNMGSMIRATSFDNAKREALVAAFSELPQRVLWKWEDEKMAGCPKNVLLRKWMPQLDVLHHPNVKVYIGHGGILGTLEAFHAGVPMVGMPVFGDQRTNIANMVSTGMGIKLDYGLITKDKVLSILREITENPSYHANAKRVSLTFRDRPMSPMDTAIYWTEYVIRHRGAPHLRSAAVDLNLAQYLLLDVLAVLLVVTALVIGVAYFMARKLKSIICGESSKVKTH